MSIKEIFCKHRYMFLDKQMNGLVERKIKAICLKCGKDLLLTTEEYKKIKEKQDKQIKQEEVN